LLFQHPFKFLLRIRNEALVTGRVNKDTGAFLRIAPKLSQQIEVAPVCAKKHIARQASSRAPTEWKVKSRRVTRRVPKE
jgi:hypothetical protein